MTSMDFGNQFRLDNFEDRYQRRITRLDKKNKYELNKKYDRINKKLTRDLRTLSWQHIEKSRKTSHLYTNIYKNQISKLSSEVKDFKGAQLHEYTVKVDKPDLEPVRYTFSKNLPRVSRKSQEKEEITNKSVYDKIKTLQCDIGIKSNNLQHLKTNHNEKCQEELYKEFYNPLNHAKNKILIDFIKNMGIQIEKKHLFKKINEKEKPISDENIEPIVEENRIKYPLEKENEFGQSSDKHVNLFQNLLQGRAYQTMMIMAKIRYEPLLQPFLYPEGTLVEHSSNIAENNDKQETITRDSILEHSTRRYVSRFLDTISKEAVIKHDDEENKRLIIFGELNRVMREAAEGNRRHKEITGRNEQDEILKQVIKIHQDISDLFSEQFLEEAIDQCAKEDGLKLIQTVTSKRSIFKATFGHNNNKNIEPELVHNFIIPETYKIIHRQHTN